MIKTGIYPQQMLISLILCFIGIQSFGQGLKVEKAFNNDYFQFPQHIMVDDMNTYLVIRQFYSGPGSQSILYKINPFGVVLFESPVKPNYDEVVDPREMIPSEDEGLFIAGNSEASCDVPQTTPFVQRYNSLGDSVWTWKYPEVDYSLTGFSLVKNVDLEDNLIFSVTNYEYMDYSSEIFMANTDGEVFDTISVYNNQHKYFELMESEELIASKMDSLFVFNFDGDVIEVRELDEDINQLAAKGDTLIVLTESKLYFLNSDLSTIDEVTFGENLQSFQLYDEALFVHGRNLSTQYVYELDFSLALTNTFSIPIELPENHVAHFSNERFSIGIPFNLTRRQAIRYLSYSLSADSDIEVKRTDAGIIDIEILDSEFNDWGEVNHYAKVLLKNFGPRELTSCRINHYLTKHIACGEYYYTEVFSGLSLEEGESQWIELGWTGFKPEVDIFAGPGEPEFNYCFYTSYANNLCDLNVSNDQYCRDLTGQLSVETNPAQAEIEIYPNPFQSTFYIKNVPPGYSAFTLYDLIGNVVLTGVYDGEVDASNLPAGTYVIEFSGENMQSINQLVVKK